MKTQSEKILDYINEHGSITARQAYHMGIMRLASRISDLKRDGQRLRTETALTATSQSIPS